MREYYGWRVRIGVIYIASSTVMEPEVTAMAPDGVSFHFSRLSLRAATAQELDEMLSGQAVEHCAMALAEAPLHAMVFGCTSGSFLRGSAGDNALVERIRRGNGGIPTTTTSRASVRALQALGAKTIALATPYVDDVTERARSFLESHGFRVPVAAGMGLSSDHEIGDVTTRAVYDFVCGLDVAGCDAVFISCTNLRTIGALPSLEAALERPVVSAIQASVWDSLRIAGVHDLCPGFGALLEKNRCEVGGSQKATGFTAG